MFWAIKKRLELLLKRAKGFLSFPNLEITCADRDLASSALQLIKECRLAPRDAIHAATAIGEKADCIVSTDADFDEAKDLKRKKL